MAGQLRYPGKVVIVTGGTSGIGLATVREFVRQGANVVFCSKPSEAEVGQTIQRELQGSGCPGDACFEVCDVREETDIKRLIGATIERYGCLDCLVNNVGSGYAEKTDDISAQKFRDLMELNVVSVLLASKHALPYLRETKGNIVNLGCMSGVLGAKDAVSYSTSKGAVIAMTKTLAIDEIKYGVRVNCVSPGFVQTPMYENYACQFPNPEVKMEEDKHCEASVESKTEEARSERSPRRARQLGSSLLFAIQFVGSKKKVPLLSSSASYHALQPNLAQD
ncbi:17-beta-hydroxysteroid dehydrogenase 14-like [Sphaerodactylus townsendi]|uniref:17-beta-hydroxysteroid dehydrogenase 14-like n=1 Tax=Sphaerodactylus townsendi TaxID=933632 RepID=UPI002025E390|nr:17-beta-hydroxysteroid dehydrogenase 14-like [Sphaerodactylus townsendi]